MARKVKIKLSNQEWRTLTEMLMQFPVAAINPVGTRDMVFYIMDKVTNRLHDRELKKENALSLKAHEIGAMQLVIQLMVSIVELDDYQMNILYKLSDVFEKWQTDRNHNITY